MAVGCVADGEFGVSYGDEAQGALSLNFDLSALTNSTKSDNALDSGVLRITNGSGGLVRRYEPASAMPESLYMLGGNYGAEITLGSNIAATFNAAERSFSGAESFTIIAGEVTNVELVCALASATIEVVFDDTIAATFADGFQFTISNGVGSLTYLADSGKGYFTAPDGVTSFSYEFRGESKVTGDEVVLSGSMTAPKEREEHKITLKFSTYLDISSVKISVDEDTDDFDDSLGFSPQPTVSGVGFNIDTMQPADGRDFQFSVTSIKVLSDVGITLFGEEIELLSSGAVVDGHSYVSYEATSDKDGVVTISAAAFMAAKDGGANVATFAMVDNSGVEGAGKATFNVTGVTPPTNIDYWSCSATLAAQVIDSTAESVDIAYRIAGTEAWRTLSATKVGDTSYEATALPTWSAKTNENGRTVYTADSDIRSGVTYDYKLIVDGAEWPTTSFTVENRSQAIPFAGMTDSSMSCFGSSNDSSTTWASGNNTFVSGLCSFGTKGGESVAELTAKAAVGNFAAGNIAFGQFKFNGIVAQTGTMSFGQPFDWTTRPKSFKVRYAATIGVADYTDSTILPSGSIDRGRIYVAIVDWSERRGVTSGSGTPSGVWDPANDTELSEGKIIGYGSTFIETSTEGDGLHDLEMEVVYYDTVTKPSSNITLVISAVTSAYGDYMVGSTDNRLWVRDFEFGY